MKITIDGVDNTAKPTHNEWTGKFDSKNYRVTGDPTSDARSYTMVDAHTLGFNVMKGGKNTLDGRIVVSDDGKTRTVTTSETDSKGNKTGSVAIYDKTIAIPRRFRGWRTFHQPSRSLRFLRMSSQSRLLDNLRRR